MKKKILILISLLWLLGAASKGQSCGSTIASQDLMLAHMQELVDVEQQAAALLEIVRVFRRDIPDSVLKTLKAHYDNYYVYHAAAMNDLANADITTYQRRIQKAREELKAMEDLLRVHSGL